MNQVPAGTLGSVGCSVLITTVGMGLGFAAMVGSLIMPSIGAIGGVALIGIQMALQIPMTCITTLLIASSVKAAKPSQTALKIIGFVAFLVTAIAALAASHAICSTISGIPPFSFLDALKFFGYDIAIQTGAGLAITCLGVSSFAACSGFSTSHSSPYPT